MRRVCAISRDQLLPRSADEHEQGGSHRDTDAQSCTHAARAPRQRTPQPAERHHFGATPGAVVQMRFHLRTLGRGQTGVEVGGQQAVI
jgi:hypothetical protein